MVDNCFKSLLIQDYISNIVLCCNFIETLSTKNVQILGMLNWHCFSKEMVESHHDDRGVLMLIPYSGIDRLAAWRKNWCFDRFNPHLMLPPCKDIELEQRGDGAIPLQYTVGRPGGSSIYRQVDTTLLWRHCYNHEVLHILRLGQDHAPGCPPIGIIPTSQILPRPTKIAF